MAQQPREGKKEMSLPPRLNEDEIDFFKKYMSDKHPLSKMVEWGSGGSTLMFLPYFKMGKLISIEHNKEWYDKVCDELKSGNYPTEYIQHIDYLWEPPMYLGEKVDIRFYGYGVPYEENPCFSSAYINPETPEISIFDADIYFVDGICRGAVLATIHAKARNRNASVFLHDHHGPEKREEWYGWATDLYSDVEKVGSTLARLYL